MYPVDDWNFLSTKLSVEHSFDSSAAADETPSYTAIPVSGVTQISLFVKKVENVKSTCFPIGASIVT